MPELSLRQEQRNMHHEKFSDLSFVNPSATLGQFACPTCGKASRDRETLRKHVNRVHQKSYAEKARTKKHTCNWPGCGKAFTATSKLDDHMNSHTGMQYCTVIDYLQNNSLHIIIHSGDRPYECEHCNKTYTSKHEFSRHLKKYHKTNIKLLNQAIGESIENGSIELDLNTPLDDHGES